MGNEQPKKINRVTKAQIDVGALKAKIHLELMRDRKNAQVIKGQKQLINKVKSKSRNKTEEILIAERVVNGLKYAQACNQLMSYAVSLRAQANFLAQNMLNAQKLKPWLTQIYSLIYAADLLGLSSLKQFKDLLRALNDPLAVNQYINPQIVELLKPSPSPYELNLYILEFSQRNNIPLEQINLPGHKFTKDFKPIQPSMKEESFADLQKKLAEQMANKVKIGDNGPNGPNGNQGGQDQGGYNPGPGFNPGPGGNGGTPNYYNLDKNKPSGPIGNSNQFSNPYGIRQSYDPRSNQNKITPNLYDNTVPSNPQQKPKQFTQSRISINSIEQIDYFPQIVPVVNPGNKIVDPEFDKICEILKAAM